MAFANDSASSLTETICSIFGIASALTEVVTTPEASAAGQLRQWLEAGRPLSSASPCDMANDLFDPPSHGTIVIDGGGSAPGRSP